MEKNCRIIIEQTEDDEGNTHIYEFNDYRVATAICNILDNIAEPAKFTKPFSDLHYIKHGFFTNDELLEFLKNDDSLK